MERTPFTSFHIVVISCVGDFVIVFSTLALSAFSGKWMFYPRCLCAVDKQFIYENFCENFCKSYVDDKVFEREIVCEVVCCWKSSCKIKYPIKQARTTIMSATNLQKHFRPNKMNNEARCNGSNTHATHHQAHQILNQTSL